MRRGQISSCGFFVGPTARWNEPRTYIVLGAPRGGTSMCAGAMRIAGIPMGENIASRSNEDRDFILHKGDVASLTTDGAKAAYIDQIRELVSAETKATKCGVGKIRSAPFIWTPFLATCEIRTSFSSCAIPQP